MDIYLHEITMIAIGTFTTGFIAWIGRSLNKHKKDHKHIKKKLDSHDNYFMLSNKQKLLERYQMYMNRGTITMYEKTIWLELYDDYVSRGGNSFIGDIKEEICEMQVEN